MCSSTRVRGKIQSLGSQQQQVASNTSPDIPHGSETWSQILEEIIARRRIFLAPSPRRHQQARGPSSKAMMVHQRKGRCINTLVGSCSIASCFRQTGPRHDGGVVERKHFSLPSQQHLRDADWTTTRRHKSVSNCRLPLGGCV
jgi:hypothetical protein